MIDPYRGRLRSKTCGSEKLTEYRSEKEDAMLTTTRDGVKIAYEERGPAHPRSSSSWLDVQPVILRATGEAFAKRHRVVSVDLRGHGESDAAGRLPISAYADDVAHLIGELKLGKVIAVGHSMGGVTVLSSRSRIPIASPASSWSTRRPFTFPPASGGDPGPGGRLSRQGTGAQRQFIEEHLFLPNGPTRPSSSVSST